MFYYSKKDPQIWLSFFYYEIDTVYIYSWKKLIKFWPILVMHLTKSIFFLAARGVQFNNGVTPPQSHWTMAKKCQFNLFSSLFSSSPKWYCNEEKEGKRKGSQNMEKWKNLQISLFGLDFFLNHYIHFLMHGHSSLSTSGLHWVRDLKALNFLFS